MKCTCCGSEMQQLLTSFYCPRCEGKDNSDVKTSDSSIKPKWNWRSWGTIKKIERDLCSYGYRITFGMNMAITASIVLRNNEIIAGDLLADSLVNDYQDGYILYYRDVDNKYCITLPGWYWEDSQWKYDEHRYIP